MRAAEIIYQLFIKGNIIGFFAQSADDIIARNNKQVRFEIQNSRQLFPLLPDFDKDLVSRSATP
jgi:hypothetical protein